MADNDQLLNQLKGKYQSILSGAPEMGIQLQNVHIEGGKLLIRGKAPNQDVKNQIWTAIKQVDPAYADLTADISIDPSLPQPSSPTSTTAGATRYTVQSGDTLSKIAKQFYGNANDYMKIFEANKGTLSDPDKIQPGQELVIPS